MSSLTPPPPTTIKQQPSLFRRFLSFLAQFAGNVSITLVFLYVLALLRRTFGAGEIRLLARNYKPNSETDLVKPPKRLSRLESEVKTSTAESKIHLALTGIASEPAETTMFRLTQAAERMPDSIAFQIQQRDGAFIPGPTWKEYLRETRKIAKSLLAFHLSNNNNNIDSFRGTVVLIVSEARFEFFATFIGIQTAGGVAATCHPLSSNEELIWACERVGARIVFVDNQRHFQALAPLVEKKHLDLLIALDSEISITKKQQPPPSMLLLSYSSFRQTYGDALLDAHLDLVISKIKPNHPCSIIFTSGARFMEKRPVLLSHDNCTFIARSLLRHHENLARFGKDPRNPSRSVPESILSYLPLSHVGTQTLDIHVPMALVAKYGAECTVWTVTYGRRGGKLWDAMSKSCPTLFLGLPVVWEKIKVRLEAYLKARNASFAVTWARNIGEKWFKAVQVNGEGAEPDGLYLAEKTIFVPAKTFLGFSRVKLLMSSGGPIHFETLEFLGSCGIHVMESYGTTTCSGPVTMGRQDFFLCGRGGYVGAPLPGVEIILANDGSRELLVRGRSVCMGILNDALLTDGLVDQDGYVHTGDLGEFESGCLKLIGRSGEMLNKLVSCTFVEQTIEERAREEIHHVIVVGWDLPLSTTGTTSTISTTTTTTKNDKILIRALIFVRPSKGNNKGNSNNTSSILSGSSIIGKVKHIVENINQKVFEPEGVRIHKFLCLSPIGQHDQDDSTRVLNSFGKEPELTMMGRPRRDVIKKRFRREVMELESGGGNVVVI
jgi:long-subunit acyl-CoA synthetase (AMP-forming)